MLRVLLYVTLLGALFLGAVLSTGNAIGAWEPPSPPAQAPDGSTTGKARKPQNHETPEKRERKR